MNFSSRGDGLLKSMFLKSFFREPNSGGKTAQITDQDRDYTRQAIQVIRQAGVVDKTGGPFGAVIVRDGRLLGAGQQDLLCGVLVRPCRLV